MSALASRCKLLETLRSFFMSLATPGRRKHLQEIAAGSAKDSGQEGREAIGVGTVGVGVCLGLSKKDSMEKKR